MKRVYQTRPDNCLAACFASILEVEIEDIPPCFVGDDGWDSQQQGRWLARLGLAAYRVDWREYSSTGLPDAMEFVLVGQTPRGHGLHAVVARPVGERGYEIVHDPVGADQDLSESLVGDPTQVLLPLPLYGDVLSKVPIGAYWTGARK